MNANRMMLALAVSAMVAATGCSIVQPHVSPKDIVNLDEDALAGPDEVTSLALTFAKAAMAKYASNREDILKTQAGGLMALLPLAGYVAYEAARGGSGAHVAALSGAGFAALSLNQVLVQASRIKVYTQAETAIGCGIGKYRLARAMLVPDESATLTWSGMLEDAERQLDGAMQDIDRARSAIRSKAFFDIGKLREDYLREKAGDRRSGLHRIAVHRAAVSLANAEIRAAASAQADSQQAVLDSLRERLSTAKRWVERIESPRALDALLINHVEKTMLDANAELDATVPNLNETSSLFASFQNNILPDARSDASIPSEPVEPPEDVLRRSVDLADFGNADVDKKPLAFVRDAKDALDDAARTIALVQSQAFGRMQSMARDTQPVMADFTGCAYAKTGAAYQAPAAALQLGAGDVDHKSTKEAALGGSVSFVLIGGTLPHAALIVTPEAKSVTMSQSTTGDMTVFVLTLPADGLPERFDVLFRDRAGGIRQATVKAKAAG